ncbi:unnamed protein product [Gadus morhua 'NCC']
MRRRAPRHHGCADVGSLSTGGCHQGDRKEQRATTADPWTGGLASQRKPGRERSRSIQDRTERGDRPPRWTPGRRTDSPERGESAPRADGRDQTPAGPDGDRTPETGRGLDHKGRFSGTGTGNGPQRKEESEETPKGDRQGESEG